MMVLIIPSERQMSVILTNIRHDILYIERLSADAHLHHSAPFPQQWELRVHHNVVTTHLTDPTNPITVSLPHYHLAST